MVHTISRHSYPGQFPKCNGSVDPLPLYDTRLVLLLTVICIAPEYSFYPCMPSSC